MMMSRRMCWTTFSCDDNDMKCMLVRCFRDAEVSVGA